MRCAQVILDIATQALDSAYTYLVPEDLDECQVGCCVLLPFGHRKATGFVIRVWDAEDDGLIAGVDPKKLKPVERVLSRPYFDEDGAALAAYVSEAYVAPLSTCVRLLAPPGGVPHMVRRDGYWQLEQPHVGEVDDRWATLLPEAAGFEPRRGAVKQQAILDALASGDLRVSELSYEFGSVSAALRSLSAKGVVRVESRRRQRGGFAPVRAERTDVHEVDFPATALPQLTDEQRRALEAVRQARAAGGRRVVVVDGVTGSGKTEVYLRAIQDVVLAGKRAIVLVPEISLTPQTVARFRGRFGDTVAVLHSAMGAGERYDQWDFIRSGAAQVVVGARSALFSPVRDLGLVVIDEEHEGSYKQDSAPRYHARDVAEWMCARAGCPLVLGSATPSVEALYRVAKDDAWQAVELRRRATGAAMPRIDVVDMAREFGGGSRSMFSKRLAGLLEETLRAGQKAVLMLNQRGFASFLLCRDCGFVPTCPSCSTSMTYHEVRGRSWLECHHCGARAQVPLRCPQCQSPYLRRFGAGTQRVEADLVQLIEGFGLPQGPAPVVRMDADTTRRKGAHAKLLEQFAAPGARVLLGTQMIAKGLDFQDVTLVGVVNADTQLHLPDFRAAERTFDLISQVAGRAGRASLPGRVVVQTYSADAAPIVAAARGDRALFLRDELPKRRALGYPPYVRLADVRVWGEREDAVAQEARALYDMLAAQLPGAGEGWSCLPPVPCVLAKVRNSFRYHIVVKAPLGADLAGRIAPVFRARKARAGVSAAADIDPQSLL